MKGPASGGSCHSVMLGLATVDSPGWGLGQSNTPKFLEYPIKWHLSSPYVLDNKAFTVLLSTS